MAGWIKIHRKLKDHWLWQDAEKLKWWLDILMQANIEDKKVLLKGTLVECKRGQCVKSLETWAKEWRTTKKTVRTFFTLLQKDGMINISSVTVSTRLTICNYESYQDKGHGLETQSKRSGHAEETQPTPDLRSKELKNDEEIKKKEEQAAPVFDFSEPLINPNRGAHCPSWPEVLRQMLTMNGTAEQAKDFFEYNEKNDWRDSKTRPIAFWPPLVNTWLTNDAIKKAKEAESAERKAAKDKPKPKPGPAGTTADDILRQRYPERYANQ